MPYCPECGEEVEENQKFCDECGNKLSDKDEKEGSSSKNEDPELKQDESSYLNKNYFLAALFIVLVTVALAGSGLFGPSEQERKDQLSSSVELDNPNWEYIGIANQNGDPYGNVQAKVTNSYDEPVTLTYRYEKLYDPESELYRDVKVTLDRWESKTLNMTTDGKSIDLEIESGELSTEKEIEVGEPSIGGIEWKQTEDSRISGIEDPHFINTEMTNKGPKKLYVRLDGEDSAEGDAIDRSSRVGVEASPGVWTEDGYDYSESSLTLGPYETKEIPIKIEWTGYGTNYPSQNVNLDFGYNYHKFEDSSDFSFEVNP